MVVDLRHLVQPVDFRRSKMESTLRAIFSSLMICWKLFSSPLCSSSSSESISCCIFPKVSKCFLAPSLLSSHFSLMSSKSFLQFKGKCFLHFPCLDHVDPLLLHVMLSITVVGTNFAATVQRFVWTCGEYASFVVTRHLTLQAET